MEEMKIPLSMERLIATVATRMEKEHRPQLARMFSDCFTNTYQKTIKRMTDGSTFIITGDIPAMWLRDSAAQVKTYLILAEEDNHIASMLEGVVKRQIQYVLHDSYANAFNEAANGAGHQNDLTRMSQWVWERKYEIDSLCYPIQLSYLIWKVTGRTAHLDEPFKSAVKEILRLWKVEQQHEAQSDYRFQRVNCPMTDTLTHEGKGTPVAYTGMTWSGFRPSDDACSYGYLVPANMFAVVVLDYIHDISEAVWKDIELSREAMALRQEINHGIQAYGVIQHEEFGPIYAYETDGMGHYTLMDDANVPSLLSIPYLGYTDITDPIYINTRRFVLSKANPYYYEGVEAQGIGSPHTPDQHIWPIALSMQGLTTESSEEKLALLDLLARTDAGTGLMHESFNVNDSTQFTRPWFSWANSLFSELVLDYCGITIHSRITAK
jgi:meiotically up-regulated gene 157 (Mug157) protein